MSFTPLSELERQLIKARLYLVMLALTGAFLLLFGRYWIMQVVEHNAWQEIAQRRQIRPVTVPAMRGKIFDRNHIPLADLRKSYNVTVTPADADDQALSLLASILGIKLSALKARIAKNRSWSPFIPVLVEEDISEEQLARIEENKLALPGVDIEIRPARKYHPQARYVAHVLGYMGEISREQLQRPEFQGYRMGDRVGVSGVEKAMERILRGTNGTAFKLVDAKGREISITPETPTGPGRLDYNRKLKDLSQMETPARPGDSVVLTIDLNLQMAAAEAMGHQAGAVAAMDLDTGEVLVLYSSPVFEPSDFAVKVEKSKWEFYLKAPSRPLFNRALLGLYPPASTFKLIVAAAGLEEQIISPETAFTCPGYYRFHDLVLGCWKKSGHGRIRLLDSIMQSCDVYYYQLGELLGIEKIAKWARRFGLGRAAGLGLLEEASGLVPDPEWKRKRFHKPWYSGETLNVAIGQGSMLVTPLQAMMIAAAIAGEGKVMFPQLILRLEDVRGNPLTRFKPRVKNEGIISRRTARLLKKAMEGVVEDEEGTAFYYARSGLLRIAGKTGTAEVSKKYRGKPLEEIPYQERDHAWFIGYAPADRPQIAVAVVVEHGGSGGAAAGPVARAVCEAFFKNFLARGPGGEEDRREQAAAMIQPSSSSPPGRRVR